MNKFTWIMIGTVIGYFFNVLTPLTLSWFQDTSSKIIVRQFYNTVEKKRPVPEQVGGLMLDYQIEADRLESVYWVEVVNEGYFWGHNT